jgi:predicted PurR-regulated permease PerM
MDGPRDPGRSAAALAVARRAAAAACGVLFVALAAFALWRSAALLALLYIAAVIAVVLDRPVAALVRRGLGRRRALALVLSGVGAGTLAAVAVALGPLVAQVRELATAAPAVVDRVRAALVGRLGSVLDGTPLAPWLHDALSRAAAALPSGVYGAAGGVANAVGAVAAALLMAVLLLASGPDLVQRAIGALPPLRRSWAEALARELWVSLGSYLAGLSTIVVARILATGAFLAIARVPFVIPLALVAGASVLIPYLGSALRLLTVGAVAWATRGSGGAVAALAFVAAYDLVENYVLSPIVYRKTLGISALGQLVAVLFLGYHFGVVGAALAIPLAATAQIVARALRSPARAAPAATACAETPRPGTGGAAHGAAREAPADGRAGD